MSAFIIATAHECGKNNETNTKEKDEIPKHLRQDSVLPKPTLSKRCKDRSHALGYKSNFLIYGYTP